MSSGLGDILYLPYPASATWLMQFAKAEDGSAIDLTLASAIEFFFLDSAHQPSADAPLTLSVGAGITVVDALAGLVRVSLSAAQHAALRNFGGYFTFAQASFADGSVVIPDLLRAWFHNDLDQVEEQQLDGATVKRLDAATGTLTPVTPDMSNYTINRYDLTGLYGGESTDLDGLSEETLASLSNGTRLQIGFSDRLVMQYVIRAKAEGEVDTPTTARLVVFDNDTDRVAELEFMHKEGVPCVWDNTAGAWKQVLVSEGGVALGASITLPT